MLNNKRKCVIHEIIPDKPISSLNSTSSCMHEARGWGRNARITYLKSCTSSMMGIALWESSSVLQTFNATVCFSSPCLLIFPCYTAANEPRPRREETSSFQSNSSLLMSLARMPFNANTARYPLISEASSMIGWYNACISLCVSFTLTSSLHNI